MGSVDCRKRIVQVLRREVEHTCRQVDTRRRAFGRQRYSAVHTSSVKEGAFSERFSSPDTVDLETLWHTHHDSMQDDDGSPSLHSVSASDSFPCPASCAPSVRFPFFQVLSSKDLSSTEFVSAISSVTARTFRSYPSHGSSLHIPWVAYPSFSCLFQRWCHISRYLLPSTHHSVPVGTGVGGGETDDARSPSPKRSGPHHSSDNQYTP